MFLYIFYFPYLYYFYSRQLTQISRQQQLFFVAIDQLGAILPLLYYVRCWIKVRNSAVLIVFTPYVDLVNELARNICPEVQVVSPRVLVSNFMQRVFGVYTRSLALTPLYYHFLRKYPETLYINQTRNDNKSGYVKYLDNTYKNHSHDSPFWDAYVQLRDVFDCRYDVTQDFYEIAKLLKGINLDEMLVRRLLNDLKISQKYVVININVKDYHNESQNTRRIVHFERYNVLIDYLINEGYSVVLQGKSEQPYFKPRKGFFDYAHSAFQSAENDLALFYGCEFYVASKTGAEWFGLVCDKPVLGLNYTELSCMQPNMRLRFFPKHIKDEAGKYLSWRKFLLHPIYFQLGRNCPTQEKFEFVEMEEHEIIAALEEFLQLLPKPREEWLNYSLQQKEFKKMLHPGHLDLYYISGVPCRAYLKEDVVL